jgi:hypothetical protein
MKHVVKMNIVWIAVLGLCVLTAGAASAEPHYLGPKSCAGCHKAETQDWQRSVHGKTMELLVAGKRSGPKHKAGLDPDKNYSNDEKCWKCHTTGFKKEGGFVDINSTPDLAGVSCEACHGPGSDYREIHKQKMLDFKSAETRAAGQTYASKGDKVCENCHNTDSPFKPSVDPKYTFNLKERLKEGTSSFHQINPTEGNHDK